jgi:NTP pyrophosphatase (non-canonical NTP hydrolase)
MKDDSNTSIQELKEKIKQFNVDRDWEQYHNPKDLAIAITTEASELLDIFKYKSQEEVSNIMKYKKYKVEEEIADVLILTLQLAQLNDIDVTKAIQNKLEINNKNYPKEMVKGKNFKKEEY